MTNRLLPKQVYTAWKFTLACFVLCFSVLFTALSSHNSYAEEAVAVDSDVEEIIVAGKVLKAATSKSANKSSKPTKQQSAKQ